MLEPVPDELIALLRRSLSEGPFLERRLGRAFALVTLYEMDLAHHDPSQVLTRTVDQVREAAGVPWPSEVVSAARSYASDLISGVLEHRASIDARIQERAPLRPLSQMSAVDRNVLRIGLYESLFGNAKVPLKAAINEAVELAKLFGSETSARFVNGVLGRAIETASHQADVEPSTGPSPGEDPGRDA